MLPSKVALIVPTCAISHIVETMDRLYQKTTPKIEIDLFLSVNYANKEEGENTINAVKQLAEMHNKVRPKPINLFVIEEDQPTGFSKAVNDGIKEGFKKGGYEFWVILNDDLLLTSGWLTSMWFATKTKKINIQNRIATNEDPVPLDALYKKRKTGQDKGWNGQIGMVGAVSDGASGVQKVEAKEGLVKHGLDEFARMWSIENANVVMNSEYLSGFCLGLTDQCLRQLCLEHSGDRGELFDERFRVGGFEDNDLCLRARASGFGLVVACSVFVGHGMSKTLNVIAPSCHNGLSNLLTYLLKYEKETQKYQKVIGCYRVAFKCVNDLAQYFSSIRRASLFLDGFAVLLTNDPTVVNDSYDAQLIHQLPEVVKDFVRLCMATKENSTEQEYIEKLPSIMKEFTKSLLDENSLNPMEIRSEFWNEEFNERDERNHTHYMADDMGADICISIDADEVIEDRLNPQLFRRMLSHPNPDTKVWHTGWLNHWESMNLIRIDKPYSMGFARMGGPRIWKPDNTRIISGSDQGLHCGNAPFITQYSTSQSTFRFRHLSAVRGIDRFKKTEFYNKIDKDFRKIYVGGNDYSHITKAEKVEVSIYNPANGIGGFCLMYEKEIPIFYAYNLSLYYSMFDRMVTVWTGEWSDEDKNWTKFDEEFPAQEDWRKFYPTGPCWEVAQYSRLFKVEWVHTPLTQEGGLAECRNSAINYYRNTNNGSISWLYFFDPDEQPDPKANVNPFLRGMAEMNDTWGFLMTFVNPTRTTTGETVYPASESIRMFRLDPMGILKFSGRVHETLDDSIKELMRGGIHPNIRKSGLVFVNQGLRGDPNTMREKLTKYQSLLCEDLEKNPLKSASWLALGLQLLNDDDHERARICLERSCLTARDAFLPYKELALMDLRNAMGLLVQARKRLTPSYEWTKVCDGLIEVLREAVPDLPIVDTVTQDVSKDLVLPSFPYDKISLEVDDGKGTNNLKIED